VPISERDEFLLPVGAHPDDHQRADPVSAGADAEMQPIGPAVDVVRAGQAAVAPAPVLLLPGPGQPGDRRGGQACGGPQVVLQRRDQVLGRQPMQVQQRQHLGDLRALAAPRREDRTAEPCPLAGGFIDPAVIHPRRGTSTAPATVVTCRGLACPLRTTSRQPFSSRSAACAAM
jgi:hypothetical protein